MKKSLKAINQKFILESYKLKNIIGGDDNLVKEVVYDTAERIRKGNAQTSEG